MDSVTPNDLPDLDSPDELRRLVERFYARVAEDDLLRPVFVDQAQVNWPEHHAKITAFWAKLELGIPGFVGSPTQRHADLAEVAPLRAEQFGRWIELFHDTIRGGWRGDHADSIMVRSWTIAEAQSRIVPGAEPWKRPPDA